MTLSEVIAKVETGRQKDKVIDKEAFLEEVLKSWRELEIARHQFEQVSDPQLIDHTIYRISAAEQQLNFLFRMAREQNIEFEGRQWEWISDEWKLD